jgi:uncharacterized protein YdeI (BOF family)
MKSKLSLLVALLSLALSATPVLARDAAVDGTYDATVMTPSGSYSVSVEVESGEVTAVYWPNGGRMHVMSGDLENGEAYGFNSRGDAVRVEIDDAAYNSEPDDD